jgi:hypothetical protein
VEPPHFAEKIGFAHSLHQHEMAAAAIADQQHSAIIAAGKDC